jgi:hypothetical protein
MVELGRRELAAAEIDCLETPKTTSVKLATLEKTTALWNT